jgi:SAM-dependent methyltransferase
LQNEYASVVLKADPIAGIRARKGFTLTQLNKLSEQEVPSRELAILRDKARYHTLSLDRIVCVMHDWAKSLLVIKCRPPTPLCPHGELGLGRLPPICAAKMENNSPTSEVDSVRGLTGNGSLHPKKLPSGDGLSPTRGHSTAPRPSVSPVSSVGLFGRLKTAVYDGAITSFTTKWYAEVLDLLPENSRLLDVGIGTGTALLANASCLRAKCITVVGVDYDQSYVEKCRTLVAQNGLASQVTCICCSFYDFKPPDGLLFDHVYFSGSFMILPDRPRAVRKAVEMLVDREDGRLYFTQTFELRKNSILEWIKPAMTYLTTIDFGNVTYVEDFDEALHQGGAIAVGSKKIEDGMDVENARESRIVVARSDLYVQPGVEAVA